MAQFKKYNGEIPYFNIAAEELIDFTSNARPVCDNCLKSITKEKDITLIPIMNEAFCPQCKEIILARIGRFPEDQHIENRRVDFYKNILGIKDEQ